MMRLSVVLIALTLMACEAPTPGFRGAEVSRHVIEGSSFTVYVKDSTAQAVRTNRQFAPRIGPLAGRASIAMQRASGCRVKSLSGDAAVLVARLSCGGPIRACDVDADLKGRRGYSLPVLRRCGDTTDA